MRIPSKLIKLVRNFSALRAGTNLATSYSSRIYDNDKDHYEFKKTTIDWGWPIDKLEFSGKIKLRLSG